MTAPTEKYNCYTTALLPIYLVIAAPKWPSYCVVIVISLIYLKSCNPDDLKVQALTLDEDRIKKILKTNKTTNIYCKHMEFLIIILNKKANIKNHVHILKYEINIYWLWSDGQNMRKNKYKIQTRNFGQNFIFKKFIT